MENIKVSTPQFFSLLYLSVLSSIFMYISSADVKIAETDSLLRPLVFAVVSILSAIPLFFVFKNFQNNSILWECFNETACFKFISIIYSIVYLFDVIRTVARFDLFASCAMRLRYTLGKSPTGAVISRLFKYSV